MLLSRVIVKIEKLISNYQEYYCDTTYTKMGIKFIRIVSCHQNCRWHIYRQVSGPFNGCSSHRLHECLSEADSNIAYTSRYSSNHGVIHPCD